MQQALGVSQRINKPETKHSSRVSTLVGIEVEQTTGTRRTRTRDGVRVLRVAEINPQDFPDPGSHDHKIKAYRHAQSGDGESVCWLSLGRSAKGSVFGRGDGFRIPLLMKIREELFLGERWAATQQLDQRIF